MMPHESADIGHYFAVLKKRKKLFILPAAVVLVIAILLAALWPPSFESSSTILIEEQQIPPEFVRSTVTGFADQRIQSLTQQILSRVKLWEIIQQFNLYRKQREKLTREEILANMRDDIKLTTISAEMTARDKRRSRSPQNDVTIAFSIAYRGSNPGTVQKVAGTLASLYLEQNLKTREAQAQSTTKFLESELKELNERIQNLGKKIEAFKVKYDGLLPEQQSFNHAQVARLESELGQLENNIRNAEERKVYLQGQLATVKPDSPVIGETGQRIMGPADRLKALEIQLVDLRAKFSDDYPDVVKVRRQIASLKKLIGQPVGNTSIRQKKIADLRSQLAQLQGKYSDHYPEVKKLKNEIAELEKTPVVQSTPRSVGQPDNPVYISLSTQIQAANTDIRSYRARQAALRDRIQMYHRRLENAPKVEQQYLALTRDYQNAQSKHQEVMNKILEARIAEGMEEHQKGEKFTLIDPASYPEQPVSPNRLLILLAGLFCSFGAGFGTVALAEHLDHSVHDSDELSRLTGIPVLGTIIRIKTTEDVIRAIRKRRLAWMISGGSLIVALILVHVFYMNLWVFAAKLFRLANKYS